MLYNDYYMAREAQRRIKELHREAELERLARLASRANADQMQSGRLARLSARALSRAGAAMIAVAERMNRPSEPLAALNPCDEAA